MQFYTNSLTQYERLKTVPVKVGNLVIGGDAPIRVQTMTTPDTMDTRATVEQSIRCIEAGAELIRITAPSKSEAENLLNIKNEIRKRGYQTPLVADIHFTPNAAEIAARIVEKVRVNPGNYVDKKKFQFIEYSDQEYSEEIQRIYDRFVPLVRICKEYGTAMRIGTNHGSLSDRIMSRYGDSPMGMVESAMEFLRIARSESYHQIVLSMKSSNPLVMVQAYRLLVRNMQDEFGILYPLHIGVTEAGDGEDGRIKSAIGIGTLLEDGIGDTIRVSLTEDPEFEIPVCQDIVARYANRKPDREAPAIKNISHSPFEYKRRISIPQYNIGTPHPPVVVADFAATGDISRETLQNIGYRYQPGIDKWNIGDAAADYIYTAGIIPEFALPGTLKVICDYSCWQNHILTKAVSSEEKYFPLYAGEEVLKAGRHSKTMNFVSLDAGKPGNLDLLSRMQGIPGVILCVYSSAGNPFQETRRFMMDMMNGKIQNPVIFSVTSCETSIDKQLIHFAVETGALLTDGMGDGIWLKNDPEKIVDTVVTGRTYLPSGNNQQFLNNTAFSILQAARTRISKTEYISCPSCGRTLFDLQETTARIRSVTSHLKGLKIAVMGCIVNGPGEMADADFGYVGSGPGKITLYKGKEVMKRAVSSEVAVDELINLLKESNEWVEPGEVNGS
ncbi:MAG: (E)-4-hydroxy-3-methylbut-2-enyl-diphosphate synthase [Bacteroidota bacterium]|nr:(E)-4-hydroxy-3-methylbut-2-enyl-diphosphate synthase [Bacteroidota bacterium]